MRVSPRVVELHCQPSNDTLTLMGFVQNLTGQFCQPVALEYPWNMICVCVGGGGGGNC